jgi:hypothetical protein
MPRDRSAREIHRRRWSTMVVIGLFLVGLPGNSNAGSNAQSQRVSVVAIDCADHRDEIPTLSVSGDSFLKAIPEPAPQELTTGVYRFDMTLPPGSYALRVSAPDHVASVKSFGCNGLATFTVLAGHDRHLVVSMEKGITIDDADCSIAGTLPVDGLAIGLVRALGGEEPAVVDSGAYYFDSLTPRRYVIRVGFSNGRHADYAVDLSDPRAPRGVICSGENAIHNRFHNISLSNLAQLASASTRSFGDNAAAQLTGGQSKALVTAYRDIFVSKVVGNIPYNDFRASVSRTGQKYDVLFFMRRKDGSFTGGGIVEIIDPVTYRIEKRQSYCPGRPVSSTLPPC